MEAKSSGPEMQVMSTHGAGLVFRKRTRPSCPLRNPLRCFVFGFGADRVAAAGRWKKDEAWPFVCCSLELRHFSLQSKGPVMLLHFSWKCMLSFSTADGGHKFEELVLLDWVMGA